jgi:WXG100 family type VII secretion target
MALHGVKVDYDAMEENAALCDNLARDCEEIMRRARAGSDQLQSVFEGETARNCERFVNDELVPVMNKIADTYTSYGQVIRQSATNMREADVGSAGQIRF